MSSLKILTKPYDAENYSLQQYHPPVNEGQRVTIGVHPQVANRIVDSLQQRWGGKEHDKTNILASQGDPLAESGLCHPKCC
jgi:hypothetical protein